MLYPARMSQALYLEKSYFLVDPIPRVASRSHPRKPGKISASIVPEILGIGYSTRQKIMNVLAGNIVDPPVEPDSFTSKAFSHGNRTELLFGKAIGTEHVAPYLSIMSPVDRQYSYSTRWYDDSTEEIVEISATPDFLAFDTTRSAFVVGEIKSPYVDWTKQEDYLEKSDDESRVYRVRMNHYVQIQTQMLVTGDEYGYLFYCIPDRHYNFTGNYAAFLITADYDLHTMILTACHKAYQEISEGNPSVYKLYKNEKLHNTAVVLASLQSHTKDLKE